MQLFTLNFILNKLIVNFITFIFICYLIVPVESCLYFCNPYISYFQLSNEMVGAILDIIVASNWASNQPDKPYLYYSICNVVQYIVTCSTSISIKRPSQTSKLVLPRLKYYLYDVDSSVVTVLTIYITPCCFVILLLCHQLLNVHYNHFISIHEISREALEYYGADP